jgi:hypothetical protein
MTKLRVHSFSISLDGYGAGPRQDLANPLGVGGMSLHEWVLRTRMFAKMFGKGDGDTGVDLPALGYRCTQHMPSANAMHAVFTRT